MARVSPLTSEQFSAWRPFAAVLDLLPAGINAELQREIGQPLVNIYALGHLQRQPGKKTGLSDLAACVNSALPRMSRIVAKLESDGLVERSTCATDGRVVIITLTPRGDELLERAMPVHDRVLRKLVVDALTTEQLAQLQDISSALVARLHPDVASPVDRQRPLSAV